MLIVDEVKKNWPAADAIELRIGKQYKIFEYSQQSGPFSHIVRSDSILIFISVMEIWDIFAYFEFF